MNTTKILLMAGVVAGAGFAHAVTYSLGAFNTSLTGVATTVSSAPFFYLNNAGMPVVNPSQLGATGFAEMSVRFKSNNKAATASSINNLVTFGFGRKDISDLSAANAALGALGGPVSGLSNWGAPILYYADTTSGLNTQVNNQYRKNTFSSAGFGESPMTAKPKDNSGASTAIAGAIVDMKVRILGSGTFSISVSHYDADGNLLSAISLLPASPLTNPQVKSAAVGFSGVGGTGMTADFVPILRYNTGYDQASGWQVDFSNATLEVVPEPSAIVALGAGLAALIARRKK